MPILLLIGDSDIARWPKELLPSSPSSSSHASANIKTSGHSGATLDQIIEPVKQELTTTRATTADQQQSATEDDDRLLILIVCAGENDIGSGIPLTKSEEALEMLFKTLFDDDGVTVSTARDQNDNKTLSQQQQQQQQQRRLIVLGPKLEPWLLDDTESRKAYIQMSRSFARVCNQYKNGVVHYVDCLTMFCEGADRPGALFGGRAVPQARYFDDDQLHLSHEGYRVWKRRVEEIMQSIIDTTE